MANLHLIKPSVLNSVIGISDNSQIPEVLSLIIVLKNHYLFYDDAIIELIKRIKPYNLNMDDDSWKIELLNMFDISRYFNTSSLFSELISCFKKDESKFIVFNKKIKETRMIFKDIYKCILYFCTDTYKEHALNVIITRDMNINTTNIYHSDETSCDVIETIINPQSIVPIMILFRQFQKFKVLCEMLNCIKNLIKRHDIGETLIKFQFGYFDERTILKIIDEINDAFYTPKILKQFQTFSVNNVLHYSQVL